MPGYLRSFLNVNQRLSASFDRLFPEYFRTPGKKTFCEDVVPSLIADRQTIYDLGAGSRPFLSPSEKSDRGIRVIGLDIDGDELSKAPAGSYDAIHVCDLAQFSGQEDADFVICQAALEHVSDTEGSMRAIASSLKPGGRAAIFVPCRNAVFARLNLILPQGFKQRILFAVFPSKAEGHDGFEAHYDNCTPSRIKKLAEQVGLKVEQERFFWISSYFSVFFPVYILWRFWTVTAATLLGNDYCETFVLVLRKESTDR